MKYEKTHEHVVEFKYASHLSKISRQRPPFQEVDVAANVFTRKS